MKVDKKIKSTQSNWKFSKEVSKNFDDHVKKSVPFYDVSHEIILGLSDFFLKDSSCCVDLGSSTGILLQKIKERHLTKKIKLIGYDNSKHMIAIAKKKSKQIKFFHKDIEKVIMPKNDFTIMLYTLQFIKPEFRQKLINNIYKSLNWGGAFILYEKIRGADARFQDILNFLYFDFKKKNNFSPEEILNKEMSLRGVMEPYTNSANLDFLKRAGFKDVMPISQYLCFTGYLAIK